MFNTNFKGVAINAIFSLMIVALLLSCSNTNDNQLEGEGQVSFSIGGSNGAKPMANTMSGASTLTISNVSVAKLFITDTNDNMAFDGSIELDTFNNQYISKSVFLPTGDYKLTSFVLLDSNGDAKYGVPTSNSTYASLVSNPLPISFSISKDNLFNQVLEVTLIEEDALVSDFGLVRFKFKLVNFMSFKIYVFDEDDTFTSTLSHVISANLLITSNTKNVSKYLEAQLNTITIKDEGYDTNYLLTISKQNYISQTYNLTYDEITNYKQSPLIVSLVKDDNLTSDFLRDGVLEVVNTTSGLMWQDDSDVHNITRNWYDAIDYCTNLDFAGFSDWYLPSYEELLSIVDTNLVISIDNGFTNINSAFKRTLSSPFYWSSTSINADYAHYVTFNSFYTPYTSKSDNNYGVRCVRER